MTPRLSSYWLYFITSTSYTLAVSLVDSMKVEVVARDNALAGLLGIQPASYDEALRRTLDAIDSSKIPSSWKDSFVSGRMDIKLSEFIEVPKHGCFVDHRSKPTRDKEVSIERVWRIGGKQGWYYANWLWKIRGYLDKLVGGVGLRRGRTHPSHINPGDAIDFWRVLYADKESGRLLLFAEMKLPGEAWLEFRVEDGDLHQIATFRPRGLGGRLYWYSIYPFHGLIFNGMLSRLVA